MTIYRYCSMCEESSKMEKKSKGKSDLGRLLVSAQRVERSARRK